MVNAETLAQRLLNPIIESASKHSKNENELGIELTKLLNKNLATLQSDDWIEKAQRALEAGRKQTLELGEELEDFPLIQLRVAMITILKNYLISQ